MQASLRQDQVESRQEASEGGQSQPPTETHHTLCLQTEGPAPRRGRAGPGAQAVGAEAACSVDLRVVHSIEMVKDAKRPYGFQPHVAMLGERSLRGAG